MPQQQPPTADEDPQQTPPFYDPNLPHDLTTLRGTSTILDTPPTTSKILAPLTPSSLRKRQLDIIPTRQSTTTNPDPNTVLIVIPTANQGKVTLLQTHLRHTAPAHINLLYPALTISDASSEVGEQPYDGAGPRGAVNRVVNAARRLLFGEYQGELVGVGTVLVASVENFIFRGDSGPVDYGVVVFCRIPLLDQKKGDDDAWEWETGVSRGVTVPVGFWKRGEGFGFEDDTGTTGVGEHGKVSVGEVLADNVAGLDKADWHLELAGRSRYGLLQEAMDKMVVPWPKVSLGD
ncbi:hypothetical protein C8A00DRAFT_31002 [Chaetomidium leptoderma]|uniref:Uncharacterized protein n=1 Tax=Chaetomidium leptoderma TaxID=669021 RepID=A0AAN6VS19_9PEZI|nr:hypothetical protein C8A00DRAFT_31002 [Chaetomidium leptoderma]